MQPIKSDRIRTCAKYKRLCVVFASSNCSLLFHRRLLHICMCWEPCDCQMWFSTISCISAHCSARSDLFDGCVSKHVSLWRSVSGSPCSYLGCFSWDSMCCVFGGECFLIPHMQIARSPFQQICTMNTMFGAGVLFILNYISMQISRSMWIWGRFSNGQACNKNLALWQFGLCLQVYPAAPSDDYNQENAGFPASKPGSVYPGTFYMQGVWAAL